MGLWRRIKRAVIRFFSGGGGGGGGYSGGGGGYSGGYRGSTSSNTSARRAYIDSYRGESDGSQRDPFKEAWTKTRNAFKVSSSRATDDPKEARRKEARKTTVDFFKPTATRNRTPEPIAQKEQQDVLRSRRKKETKDWYKATNHRYDVKGAKGDDERRKRRQAVKSRAFDADTAVAEEKHELKYHPYAYSGARRAARGLSLAGELLEKKGTKGEAKKAQEYFEKNHNKVAGGIGEAAGTMAAFALTANPSKVAVKKVLPKAVRVSAEKGGTKLAARLAENKLIRKAAEKEVKNAVKKGVAKKVTKSAVENAAKQKAKETVANLGEDFAQNITTGVINDISRASANHKVGSKEWRKELAVSGAMNFGLGGAATVGLPALGKGVKRALGGVSEGVEKVVKNDNAAYEALARRAGLSTLELPRVSAKKQAPKVKVDLGRRRTTDVIVPNEKPRVKVDLGRKRTTDVRVEEALNDTDNSARQMTIDDITTNTSPSRQTTIEDVINERPLEPREQNVKENIIAEMEEAHRVAADTARPEAERQAAADRWSELNDELNETEASKEAAVENTPQKAKTPKKQAESDEKAMLDDVQREREAKMDAALRNETEGEYGYRRGEHTATAHAPIDEARRIESEQQRVYKQLKEGDIDGLFEDSETPFGIFKTANKTERQRIAGEAVVRVRDDAYGVVSRLKEKAKRITEGLSKESALSSAEHVTLDDIADITAMRNMFDDAGLSLPAEYEEAFSRIIEWQRTEAAQMLKAVDLFLKENDANYRRAFIQRDMDNYLRKVLHADASEIADIKRSLDANNGDGYWDKMISSLSEYKGAKSEAEFRKAYADFQAEVFMNSKPTVWDTINLWRHAFMLSSPKTGGNNIIGNIMQRVMYRVSDETNIVLENAFSKINPNIKRTTAHLKTSDQRRLARIYTSGKRGNANIKRNADYIKGFDDEAFADAINIASDADVGDMMASSKYMGDVVKGLKYKPTTAAGNVKKVLTKGGALQNEYVSLMLNEPDSWFVERNYRMTLLKYLEANGVRDSKSLSTKEGQKLFKEARAYAKDTALENTYKKANRVVTFLEGLRRKGHTKGSGAGYKAAALMLDAELPYLKVPANLVINNFKYSPLGAFKGGVDAFRGVIKGDVDLLNSATRELSKGLTGTGMMALGYMMFCRDQTDDDSWGFIADARDELKEYGVRDNSFKIGDKNFNISNMGIGAVQFLMGASLAEDLAEAGETPPYQVVLDAISKTVDVVADMSLMENAISLLDAFGNGGDYDATLSDRLGRAGTEIAGDYAAQFISNPLRGVAKGITDADLDTGVKKGDTTKVQRLLERNANNVVQGVPFLNERVLAHKVDTHGNLINERKTGKEKTLAVLNNTLNPFSTNTVKIPEVDKEELKVTKKNGEPFKPKGFDKDRTYTAKVGASSNAEIVDLNRKEREQVARSAKRSGYDGALSLVEAGMFGDRLGDRAQEILATIPENEEDARKMIFATAEWKAAPNDKRAYWLNKWYGEGQGNNNKGVERTRKEEAYVNVAGNSEGDFRFQNDLHYKQQDKYYNNDLESIGIDKGTWADIVQACKDSNHKWKEDEQKNVDTINSAKKTKAGILSIEGLTPEQRIAAYQAFRGKQTGFGWNDWDGVSLGGSGRRRKGYRRRGYSRGGSSKTVKTSVPIKASDFKATKGTYKDMAAALQPRSTSKRKTSVKTATTKTKIEPPKVKFKKYTI